MERRATEIVAHHHRNGRMIRYDVTSPLNAMAQVVAEWDEHGPVHINRTQSLFAAPKKGAPKESWPRTVREVAPGFFGGMASRDRRILGQTIVLGLAAVILGKAFISESFEVLGPPVGAYVQATLRGMEPTSVAMPDGKPANLDATQLAEVENSVDHERQKVRMLISDNIEVPLMRFVVVEAEAVRPALLAMAGDSGNITINGASFSAAQAHAGARLLRKRSEEWARLRLANRSAPHTRRCLADFKRRQLPIRFESGTDIVLICSTSDLGQKADVSAALGNFCYGPKADILDEPSSSR